MAITYSIDANHSLVHAKFSEIIDMDDFITFFKALRTSETFQPSFFGLCDWQDVKNITVDFNGMQCIASSCPWGKDSCRAIVVASPVMFGMSRMFQNISGDDHGTIKIFQDLDSAETWLNVMQNTSNHPPTHGAEEAQATT